MSQIPPLRGNSWVQPFEQRPEATAAFVGHPTCFCGRSAASLTGEPAGAAVLVSDTLGPSQRAQLLSSASSPAQHCCHCRRCRPPALEPPPRLPVTWRGRWHTLLTGAFSFCGVGRRPQASPLPVCQHLLSCNGAQVPVWQ